MRTVFIQPYFSVSQKWFFLRYYGKTLKQFTCVLWVINIFLPNKNSLLGVVVLCYFARRDIEVRDTCQWQNPGWSQIKVMTV
jgi:hypothetical protein